MTSEFEEKFKKELYKWHSEGKCILIPKDEYYELLEKVKVAAVETGKKSRSEYYLLKKILKMASERSGPPAECYLQFANELREKIHKLSHVKGASKLERKINAEIKFLRNLLRKKSKVQESHLKSSNLSHYAAIVHAAENLPAVTEILRPFSCPGKSENLVVDVVAGQGHLWVKVIARKAQALHLIWAGHGQFGERDLLHQSEDYMTSAKSHTHVYTAPHLYFVFYNNVTTPMAAALRGSGVKVVGHEVPVDKDVEYKLMCLDDDEEEEEVEEDNGSGDSEDDAVEQVEHPSRVKDCVGTKGEGKRSHNHDDCRIVSASTFYGQNKESKSEDSNMKQLSQNIESFSLNQSSTPTSNPAASSQSREQTQVFNDLGQSESSSSRSTNVIRIEQLEACDGTLEMTEVSNTCDNISSISTLSSSKEDEPEPKSLTKEAKQEASKSSPSTKPLSKPSEGLSKTSSKEDAPEPKSPSKEEPTQIDSNSLTSTKPLSKSNDGSSKTSSKETNLTSHEVSKELVASPQSLSNYDRLMKELLGVLPDIRGNIVDCSQNILLSVNRVNLDITTLITLVSGVTHGSNNYIFTEKILTMQAEEERDQPVLPVLLDFMKGKELYACRAAVDDFRTILATLGGSGERQRAEELLERVTIVEDNPSQKALALLNHGKIRERSKIIFGTGDSLEAITMTGNSGFLRAAQGQGVSFAVFVHAARALTEDKEKTATPLSSSH